MLPGTWLYAYLGSLATTAATLTDETAGADPQKLVLTLVGFAATAIVVILMTRAAQRALKEELAGTTS
jgi:multisubunit Na+/H+ antiporter MnhC subunit